MILLAFAMLMLLAYRGYSPILAAPLVAILAVVLTDYLEALPAFTGIYMERFGVFITRYFPVILLGATFGKMLEYSGMVAGIGDRIGKVASPAAAIIGIVILAALLTYGGVSVFVVAFAIFPVGALLFKRLSVPKRLLPAVITLGGGSFTLGAMPGTPQLPNLIPIDVLGTTEWAAPTLGMAASIMLLVTGIVYLILRAARMRSQGEGYGEIEEGDLTEAKSHHGMLISLVPLAVVFVGNIAFSALLEISYGSDVELILPGLAKPISIPAHSAEATWSIMAALLIGCITIYMLDMGRCHVELQKNIKTIVSTSLTSTAAVASVFGCGAILVDLPGFMTITEDISKIHDPLLNAVTSTSIISALTGSASGGITIAVDAYGASWLQASEAAGIPAEVLHRIMSVASSGFDNMPHNTILLFLICGVTHRASYPDMFGLTLIKGAVAYLLVLFYYSTGLV